MAGDQRPLRADPDQLRGVAGALHQAFPPGGAGDPGLDDALAKLDGRYRPDAAADARMNLLLERLKRLPWDQAEEHGRPAG